MMERTIALIAWAVVALGCQDSGDVPVSTDKPADPEVVAENGSPTGPVNAGPREGVIRFATFNVALNRSGAGDLVGELEAGSDQAKRLAAIVQRVRPHVLLINELDYDGEHASMHRFCEDYLGKDQPGSTIGEVRRPAPSAIEYAHRFTASVNTGEPSGVDLDGDGEVTAGDAFGYGAFPGQYGMAVLSQFPISRDEIRTFQKLRWADMPGASLPVQADGRAYYSSKALDVFRLSSKSHWDVPINIDGHTVHFLACHPTPPVFDGPEDRNGLRNHDEIRLFADFVAGGDRAAYLTDDTGQRGGLAFGENFVIAGDMNADPADGASARNAILQLLEHNAITPVEPRSAGAVVAAKHQGGANDEHLGDSALDTGDFSDKQVGNLRIDYVLPSTTMKVVGSGVFWPKPGEDGAELVSASDHRLVWVDVELAELQGSDP